MKKMIPYIVSIISIISISSTSLAQMTVIGDYDQSLTDAIIRSQHISDNLNQRENQNSAQSEMLWNQVQGTWDLISTRCVNEKTSTNSPAQIVKFNFLNFQPNVRLDIFKNSEGKRVVQKSVKENSCHSEIVKTSKGYFFQVKYEIATQAQSTDKGATLLVQSAYENPELKNISYEMDKASVCGNRFQNMLMNIFSRIQFPGYFIHEAKRAYSFRVSPESGQLAIRFNAPEICSDADTVMTFKRVK